MEPGDCSAGARQRQPLQEGPWGGYGKGTVYEVHSIKRPGRPFGAIVASAVLLVGCLGLAAGLVASRGLGGEVHPEGWGIAFRPPVGWQASDSGGESPPTHLSYHRAASLDGKRELHFVRRANPQRRGPGQICGFEASRFFGIAGGLSGIAR